MFCNKCGAQLTPDALFCPRCGAKAVPPTSGPNQTSSQNTQNAQNGAYRANPNSGPGNTGAPRWNGNFTGNTPPPPPPPYRPASSPSNSNLICALGFVPFLFWLPLVAERDNKLGRHTANQGLILLIIVLIRMVCERIVDTLFNWTWGFPFQLANGLVNGVFGLLFGAVSIYVLVCMIIGIVKSLKGEEFELPLFGRMNIIN